MKKLLAKLLGIKPIYKIVEVASPRITHNTDKETNEAILTLAAHPGFVALLGRLGAVNASLKAKLIHERHTDIAAVSFLQAGVFWSNWLKSELGRATVKLPERRQDPMEEELTAFNEIDALIERVG